MKKLLSLFLALTMCVLLFGCSGMPSLPSEPSEVGGNTAPAETVPAVTEPSGSDSLDAELLPEEAYWHNGSFIFEPYESLYYIPFLLGNLKNNLTLYHSYILLVMHDFYRLRIRRFRVRLSTGVPLFCFF